MPVVVSLLNVGLSAAATGFAIGQHGADHLWRAGRGERLPALGADEQGDEPQSDVDPWWGQPIHGGTLSLIADDCRWKAERGNPPDRFINALSVYAAVITLFVVAQVLSTFGAGARIR
jgi:hypothetical protein